MFAVVEGENVLFLYRRNITNCRNYTPQKGHDVVHALFVCFQRVFL